MNIIFFVKIVTFGEQSEFTNSTEALFSDSPSFHEEKKCNWQLKCFLECELKSQFVIKRENTMTYIHLLII